MARWIALALLSFTASFAMAATPYRFTATEAVNALKNGSLTAEDYALSLLGRIEERDSTVKAWAHLDRDQVLAQARALDEVPKENRGPLHGVAVGIKDVIYTKGKRCWPT